MVTKNDYIAISIESRKGGVGKTTLALCLARLLIDKGYEVVYLDIDITGTEAAKACGVIDKMKMFADKLHVVQTSVKNKHADIVEMFGEYMTGEDITKVAFNGHHSEEIGDSLRLKTGKVNVFSSYLQPLKNKSKTDAQKSKYGSSVLFDELHSMWFMEMLKNLVDNCAASLKDIASEKKLIVIFDNSPGNTGLTPAVEEWLTDLGPERGKFIFTGSIDSQDLLACMDAIEGVNDKFLQKWNTSRSLISTLEIEKEKTERSTVRPSTSIEFKPLSNIDKRFFNRLLEGMPAGKSNYDICRYAYNSDMPLLEHLKQDSCTNCGLCFYWIKDAEQYDSLIHPWNYLALIPNKVPSFELIENLNLLFDALLKRGNEAEKPVHSIYENIEIVSVPYIFIYALMYIDTETILNDERFKKLSKTDALPIDQRQLFQKLRQVKSNFNKKTKGHAYAHFEDSKRLLASIWSVIEQYDNGLQSAADLSFQGVERSEFPLAELRLISTYIYTIVDVEELCRGYSNANDAPLSRATSIIKYMNLLTNRTGSFNAIFSTFIIFNDQDFINGLDILTKRPVAKRVEKALGITTGKVKIAPMDALEIDRQIDVVVTACASIYKVLPIQENTFSLEDYPDIIFTIAILVVRDRIIASKKKSGTLKINFPVLWRGVINRKYDIGKISELVAQKCRDGFFGEFVATKNVDADRIHSIFINFCVANIRYLEAEKDFSFLIETIKTLYVNRFNTDDKLTKDIIDEASKVVLSRLFTVDTGLKNLRRLGLPEQKSKKTTQAMQSLDETILALRDSIQAGKLSAPDRDSMLKGVESLGRKIKLMDQELEINAANKELRGLESNREMENALKTIVQERWGL